MAELAGDVQEGLLAMAVGTGLQVMAAMMSVDVEAACGPKGKHDPARTAVRHGRVDGSVTPGGTRVPVTRPRMRAADGSGELPVASYELFSRTRCWAGWRWAGCWPGSRRAATRPGWNRSGSGSRGRPAPRASPRSADGSSPRPRPVSYTHLRA